MRRAWLVRSLRNLLVVVAVAAAAGIATMPPAAASEDTCSTTQALALGGPALAGTVSSTSKAACFTFSASAGDNFRFNVRATSGGFSPFTDVFNPSGTSICATPGDLECATAVAGTWMVQITGGTTGTFNIYGQRLDNPIGCKAVTFGHAPVTGKIAAAADAACFTFTGSSAGVVYVHAIPTSGSLGSGPSLELDGPNGADVCTSFETLECTLTTTGTQGVLAFASGTSTGHFHFYVQLLTDPKGCKTLKFGSAPVAAKISTVGAVGCFTFAGKAGETVTVDPVVTSGTLSPETDDFSPAGVSTCATPGELVCTLTATGTWTTLITDGNGSHTGDYTIFAEDLSLSPASGPPATAVAVSSSGFKSGESVTMNYETGLSSPTTETICTAVASSGGVASCSGDIPAAAHAGADGVHVVEGTGASSHLTTKGLFTLTA